MSFEDVSEMPISLNDDAEVLAVALKVMVDTKVLRC